MSGFYRLAYRLGFTPWERAAEHEPAARHVLELLDRERQRRRGPPGRALDIGCGSGGWAIELARRGWQVTGIDLVAKAVQGARARAAAAALPVEIVEADVTAMRAAGVRGPFDLFWDFGTLHGLDAGQRRAAGEAIRALAAPGAVLLSLAWEPGRRGPLPRGMSAEEVRAMLPGWRLTGTEPFDATGLPGPLRGVAPRVYRLEA